MISNSPTLVKNKNESKYQKQMNPSKLNRNMLSEEYKDSSMIRQMSVKGDYDTNKNYHTNIEAKSHTVEQESPKKINNEFGNPFSIAKEVDEDIEARSQSDNSMDEFPR